MSTRIHVSTETKCTAIALLDTVTCSVTKLVGTRPDDVSVLSEEDCTLFGGCQYYIQVILKGAAPPYCATHAI